MSKNNINDNLGAELRKTLANIETRIADLERIVSKLDKDVDEANRFIQLHPRIEE